MYYSYCADGSPMMCVRAHLHGKHGNASINAEISSKVLHHLKQPGGSHHLGNIAQHCAGVLSGPLMAASGRFNFDTSITGHDMVRMRLIRNGDFPSRQLMRLGEVFTLAAQHALFDGTVATTPEAGFSCSLEWLYTAWVFEREGSSYFLTQIHVPADVSPKRLKAFDPRLRQFVRSKLTAVHGTPQEFFLHEETPEDPMRVQGAAGNFSAGAADERIARLFESALRRQG